MSFFSDASLVYVPSGVKDAKTYSIKPTDGSGDLTFSRGSDIEATRVNSQGYIEKAKVNLLLQSNTFSTTWLNSGTITKTSGQSGYDGSSDAWRIDKGSAGAFIRQTNSQSGLRTLSVYAKAGTIDWLLIVIDGSPDAFQYFDLANGVLGATGTNLDATITSIGGSWHRCSVTGADTYTEVKIYPAEGDNNVSATSGNIYIQDAQLNYGLVAQDYVETTTAAVVTGITNDMPRLNYDPANPTCPSLLLEPSRTNSVSYSEYIGPYFFYANASASNNQTTSPEGVVNAASIIPDATSAIHQIASSSITASGAFTLSAFVKAGELNKVAIREVYATGAFASFDLSTGTKIDDNVNGDAFIEAYSNGWYRIGITYTFSGNIRLGINVLSDSYTSGNPSSGANYWSSNGTDKLYIYGLQCELGVTYKSSYLPTYGTSATRTAEACTKTGISSLIGQTEGTIFVEADLSSDIDASNIRGLFELNDGTTDNRFSIYRGSNDLSLTALIFNGGVSQAVFVISSISGIVKIALGYNSSGATLYVNGSLIGTDASVSVPACSDLDLGLITNRTDRILGDGIKQVLLFTSRLSNADLATLTA